MSSENTKNDNSDTYNKPGFYTFIAGLTVSFVFFIYISFLHPGVKLGGVVVPDSVKEKIANESADAVGAESNFDITTVTNPWVSSAGMIAHGKKTYATNCAFCHGNTGKGDGVAGATLNPKPRDLVEGNWTNDGSTIGLHKTITSGIGGTAMAAFGHLSAADRWGMVHYIYSITNNKKETAASDLEAYAKSAK